MSFPKLADFERTFSQLHCNDDCLNKTENCVTHKVKCLQYERATYEHKGEQKKKLKLLEKFLTLSGLLDLMQQHLCDFPRHRFNFNHTRSVWNKVEEFLENDAVVKIQDFSENYTCLLPKEVQSLHWNQKQCTVYPLAVLRKVDSEIRGPLCYHK